MHEHEVIELLKYYRHSLSNHLQLIISYAQMGKLDRVQDKSKELLELMNTDQKFYNLDLPKTVISLMHLNHKKSGLDWQLIIGCDHKPEVDDQKLARLIESIHQQIIDQAVNLSLYHGTIKFLQEKNQPFQLKLICRGPFQSIEQLREQLLKLDIGIRIDSATEGEFVFTWVHNN